MMEIAAKRSHEFFFLNRYLLSVDLDEYKKHNLFTFSDAKIHRAK